jgi:hypothetical protein
MALTAAEGVLTTPAAGPTSPIGRLVVLLLSLWLAVGTPLRVDIGTEYHLHVDGVGIDTTGGAVSMTAAQHAALHRASIPQVRSEQLPAAAVLIATLVAALLNISWIQSGATRLRGWIRLLSPPPPLTA